WRRGRNRAIRARWCSSRLSVPPGTHLCRPMRRAPAQDPPERLADDRAVHLRLSLLPLDERDGNLDDPQPGTLYPPSHVDLKAIALRRDPVKVQRTQRLGTV